MSRKACLGLAITLCALWLPVAARAAPADAHKDRTGKDVVDEVCAKCHATGEGGAPKIGDRAAWKSRSSRGLTSLTQSALKGMRNMPPHGGRFDLTDIELKRAITYMVNQSGGKWIEPASTASAPRAGKEIVEARCGSCHTEGKGGAPKIGDRSEWAPHLSKGLDATVRSAIAGHGGMPARGGLANLTDQEVRSAIVYMFSASKGNSPAK